MLRQVNIDGVLYKIGDSRFEGDNLAYIQLPESITVGTPLTDLAPIQKALDSTDGSLLYAPSLNVFFAPTASSTPATTRIWASTTGDKGYQLKATLNESGLLSSAVVVEAPAGEGAYIVELMDAMALMGGDANCFTPVTTPEAIAWAKDVYDHANMPLIGHIDMGIMNYYVPITREVGLCMDNTYGYFGCNFIRLRLVLVEDYIDIRIFLTVNASSVYEVSGVTINTASVDLTIYNELITATEALPSTSKYVDTDDAIAFAKKFLDLKEIRYIAQRGNYPVLDTKYRLTNITNYDVVGTDEFCYLTFSPDASAKEILGVDRYDVNIFVKNEATILGITITPSADDCVKVSKEYMEVPTGHAPHTSLEASISGTTLNITHKNESHISSVIHVPKSVLFTSPSAFELKFAPNTSQGSTTYTPNAKIEISKDGVNWTQPVWDKTNGISLKADTLNDELGKYSVFIRSDNYINTSSKFSSFSALLGTNIEVSGILDAMWGGKKTATYCGQRMFYSLTPLISAKNLVFSDKVANYCYQFMFQNCTSLTLPPQLPATKMALSCYRSMFFKCESLIQAPILPATTLAESCYATMFNYCESLIQAPALPATTLAIGCYQAMFDDCISLTQIPKLPATTLAESCYSNMFSDCIALIQPPELPATIMVKNCYSYMFVGCTALTQAPELPSTTLAEGCYSYMFRGCRALTQTPELPATTLEASCYREMFKNCISLTKPAILPVIDGIPIVTTGGTMLSSMFEGCTGIKWATSGTPYIISTTDGTVAETAHLKNMFKDNGGTPPEGTGIPKLNTTYYLAE